MTGQGKKTGPNRTIHSFRLLISQTYQHVVPIGSLQSRSDPIEAEHFGYRWLAILSVGGKRSYWKKQALNSQS